MLIVYILHYTKTKQIKNDKKNKIKNNLKQVQTNDN